MTLKCVIWADHLVVFRARISSKSGGRQEKPEVAGAAIAEDAGSPANISWKSLTVILSCAVLASPSVTP